MRRKINDFGKVDKKSEIMSYCLTNFCKVCLNYLEKSFFLGKLLLFSINFKFEREFFNE